MGSAITPRDVFDAYADQCVTEYHLARQRGVSDPVILINAPDPTDLDDVEVISRERLEIATDGSTGTDCADALSTAPADWLNVLVLFGDEVHGYTMDRPPG